MDALRMLTERVSSPQLTGPDITRQQQEVLLRAALRAPDHAWLRPSRYVLVEGDDRRLLGECFLQATPGWQELSAEKQQKLLNMPLRAPLLIVAVSRIQEHPKVPRDEQLLSTGAGVQNILNAAWAMGLGAIWRTGDMATNPKVTEALGLEACDVIVGFVYIGHINGSLKQPPELPLDDFVTRWKAKSS
jgi:nitroreductase